MNFTVAVKLIKNFFKKEKAKSKILFFKKKWKIKFLFLTNKFHHFFLANRLVNFTLSLFHTSFIDTFASHSLREALKTKNLSHQIKTLTAEAKKNFR